MSAPFTIEGISELGKGDTDHLGVGFCVDNKIHGSFYDGDACYEEVSVRGDGCLSDPLNKSWKGKCRKSGATWIIGEKIEFNALFPF